MMTNVCRVFNDKVGVASCCQLKPTLRPVPKPRARPQELVERTGRNPCYEYLQLGCSQRAVQRMLHYARTQCVGKPFSNYGMARSVLWPRNTDGSSFFCAELVAAILKEGGLMDQSSNPGSATPELLHKMYKGRAAAAANPYALRDLAANHGISLAHTIGTGQAPPSEEREALLQQRAVLAPMPAARPFAYERPAALGRSGSPPRSQFRVISQGGAGAAAVAAAARSPHAQAVRPRATGAAGVGVGACGARPQGLSLTLNSLDMAAVRARNS